MKPIQKDQLTPNEEVNIIAQGKDPNDYVAMNIVAMGLELQPQVARVKDHEDSDIRHECLLALMPIPLPIDKKILQQNQLIVPTMEQNSPIQKVLAEIPMVRLVLKKEAIVQTLQGDE